MNNKTTTEKIMYLWLIFLAGCFIGWMYEEIFYWCTEGLLRNRGVLYGPWLPIYGSGAIAIYMMKPLKKKPVLLFFSCVILTGIVEYIVGYISIRYFNMRLWDYRGLFLNLEGIICFRSVISFGIMGVAFHYIIEPLAERQFAKINKTTSIVCCSVLAIVFITDTVLSILYRTPITY